MADPTGRYRQGDGLGRDELLDRAVELRAAAPAGAEELLAEARFLARLEHPAIPCVHDVVRGEDGALLVGRPVEGITLAEAVARLAAGTPVPELATPAACVVTMLKVCDALAAAHARGVVHRALRPEGVLLAWHGQVLVVDWRAAREGAQRPQTRRFTAHTAPPAAVDLDGRHDDIRALGACLFTALALHPPGAVGAAASARVPPALEAVSRRALASDAVAGYHTVEELAADLQRFLEDGQPTAFRPGPLLRLRRWLEQRRRALAWVALALLLALGAVAALFGERLRAYATWGDPVVAEDFADDGWRGRWQEGTAGTWQRQDGRLVTTGEQGAMLLCTRRLTTPVAIEYEGTILPGSRPCDLSVVWSEHAEALTDPGAQRRSFYIQAGAYENSFRLSCRSADSLTGSV